MCEYTYSNHILSFTWHGNAWHAHPYDFYWFEKKIIIIDQFDEKEIRFVLTLYKRIGKKLVDCAKFFDWFTYKWFKPHDQQIIPSWFHSFYMFLYLLYFFVWKIRYIFLLYPFSSMHFLFGCRDHFTNGFIRLYYIDSI